MEDSTLAEDPTGHADAWAKVHSVDGILVPGGFGERGTEGKILTAKYARENKVPFLGICLGLQAAVIEYARNILDMKNAHHRDGPKLSRSCGNLHARGLNDTYGWNYASWFAAHHIPDTGM